EGAGVGVLLVEGNLAREVGLRGGERGLLDGRQLHLQLGPFGLEALAQFVQFLLAVGDLPGHGRRNLASAAQGGNESPSVARRRISAWGWPRRATSTTLTRERVPALKGDRGPGHAQRLGERPPGLLRGPAILGCGPDAHHDPPIV